MIDGLPFSPPDPIGAMAQGWSNGKEANFPESRDHVDILNNCHKLEAYWVLDELLGDQKELREKSLRWPFS